MKHIFFAIIFIALTGFFTSCEEVIDLPLKTSPSQLVIKGNIYDEPGPYLVKISMSVPVNDPNVFPPVSDAIVTIRDDAGNSEVLTEAVPGTYSTSTLQGTPGRTYTLSVETAGKTYTATSTMPSPIELDSLYSVESEFSGFFQINADFKDPANIKNYYHLVDFINGERQKNILVSDDIINEGKTINAMLMYDTDQMKSGDTFTLWLECIDKGAYDYFRTSNVDEGSASPTNPNSNISNEALGYFNACSVRKKTIIVP
jgi:Domain of unknown function (DUF4249)